MALIYLQNVWKKIILVQPVQQDSLQTQKDRKISKSEDLKRNVLSSRDLFRLFHRMII